MYDIVERSDTKKPWCIVCGTFFRTIAYDLELVLACPKCWKARDFEGQPAQDAAMLDGKLASRSKRAEAVEWMRSVGKLPRDAPNQTPKPSPRAAIVQSTAGAASDVLDGQNDGNSSGDSDKEYEPPAGGAPGSRRSSKSWTRRLSLQSATSLTPSRLGSKEVSRTWTTGSLPTSPGQGALPGAVPSRQASKALASAVPSRQASKALADIRPMPAALEGAMELGEDAVSQPSTSAGTPESKPSSEAQEDGSEQSSPRPFEDLVSPWSPPDYRPDLQELRRLKSKDSSDSRRASLATLRLAGGSAPVTPSEATAPASASRRGSKSMPAASLPRVPPVAASPQHAGAGSRQGSKGLAAPGAGSRRPSKAADAARPALEEHAVARTLSSPPRGLGSPKNAESTLVTAAEILLRVAAASSRAGSLSAAGGRRPSKTSPLAAGSSRTPSKGGARMAAGGREQEPKPALGAASTPLGSRSNSKGAPTGRANADFGGLRRQQRSRSLADVHLGARTPQSCQSPLSTPPASGRSHGSDQGSAPGSDISRALQLTSVQLVRDVLMKYMRRNSLTEEDIFRSLDSDRDDLVKGPELQPALKRLGVILMPHELNEVMQALVPPGEKGISLQRWFELTQTVSPNPLDAPATYDKMHGFVVGERVRVTVTPLAEITYRTGTHLDTATVVGLGAEKGTVRVRMDGSEQGCMSVRPKRLVRLQEARPEPEESQVTPVGPWVRPPYVSRPGPADVPLAMWRRGPVSEMRWLQRRPTL